MNNTVFDLDTYCPAYECDGQGATSTKCLGDDPVETLFKHRGVAPAAKLAIFDVAIGPELIFADLAGNDLWNVANGTGAMVHTNSWGSDSLCEMDDQSVLYDTYMYQVRNTKLLQGYFGW